MSLQVSHLLVSGKGPREAFSERADLGLSEVGVRGRGRKEVKRSRLLVIRQKGTGDVVPGVVTVLGTAAGHAGHLGQQILRVLATVCLREMMGVS